MRIKIITPAGKNSLSGNRATAKRWAGFLKQAGHRVSIEVKWDGQPCDCFIALHAWRSADSIRAFRETFADTPLIVVLTGTDLYRFIDSHPETTRRSLALADRLVTLHAGAANALPEKYRHKVRVIHQSARPLPGTVRPSRRYFDICVVGHLRDEKDPLRTALAVRSLPQDSRIRVLHFGRPHDAVWQRRAQDEMKRNPRYHWYGEVPHWRVRRVYGQSRLMVLSSVMEGGANVISEACVSGLPVIASRIDGSIGLLGNDYPGYYPVQDTDALRRRLLQAEHEPDYLTRLRQHCRARAVDFTPQREQQALQRLVG